MDVERFAAPLQAMKMMTAAWGVLNNLTPAQRDEMCFPLDDTASRWDWDFIPKYGRKGLRMRDMNDHQKMLTQQLVACALSIEGYSKVVQIMGHENTLREINAPAFGFAATEMRHPENYFLSIFGEPHIEGTGAWRFVGHHVSLSFTLVGAAVAPTPLLLGAEPARVGTFDPLRDDEDRGFELMGSLADDQRAAAIISEMAPANFVTRVVQKLGRREVPGEHELGFAHYSVADAEREALAWVRDSAKGLAGRDMDKKQRQMLRAIIESFVARLPNDVANNHLAAVDGVGLEAFTFTWAGHTGPGKAHYYRVQGPSFLVEFDNAQDDGNHIHTVWRDPENDFGEDLLATHYAQDHDHFHHERVESSDPI